MARHHIRDEKGDLHIYNDEEYKQYKFNKGCYGIFALLVFVIGGLLSKCGDDKSTTSSSKVEEFVNSEVAYPTEKSNNTTDMNLLMNEQSQIEESEEETQNPIDEIEANSTIQENVQDASSNNEVVHEDSYSENNDESYSVDPKELKKQQKEERKRQKQMEKEAKRRAKEEAKEATNNDY